MIDRVPDKSRRDPDAWAKSWKTSHLGPLSGKETDFLLELMYSSYHQSRVEAGPGYNWPLLWEYVDRQGLGGILGGLCLDELIELPGPVEQHATHRYFSTQMHYAQAERCCMAIQEAAVGLDLPVTVLKGPALVHQAYADKGVRQFSDIDLFAGCLDDVKKLCGVLGAKEIKSFEKQGYLHRLGESECCGYQLDNWELEFRYPVSPAGEPMFDLLNYHRDALIQVPRGEFAILEPDPELHLVFLIQHMAIHHLLSRFFWFYDIAVFLRGHPGLDLEKVERELVRFGQLNVACVVTEFCHNHIDSSLPMLKPLKRGWNLPAMQSFAEPVHIVSGKYGIYHKRLSAKIFAYLVGVVSFYLVADSGGGASAVFSGTRWTCCRIAQSLGLKRTMRPFCIISAPFIAAALLPLSLAFVLHAKTGKPALRLKKNRG
jgi:hypothetical protein